MLKTFMLLVLLATSWNAQGQPSAKGFSAESEEERNARMAWWREARFGLFIHWGLYAIPAGEWKGRTQYGEWIRNRAEIPLEEYDKFIDQFNPVKFDARKWVRLANNAGMKYIVITSKHHDGFGLFDSKETGFDVMATPFRRDILKELADACEAEGIKLCFYHSIMDWHHPDYLPRREWEKGIRPAGDAQFDRYVAFMKRQLKELLTGYGNIGVLWFDGEWEPTWNASYGRDVYNYVRTLQPSIIVNNRVGAGRAGMAGMTREGEFGGDFGTPEQEVPATGLAGLDWETCMTMNRHWGYNKVDHDWKTGDDLIRMLSDIASKGGNFLLNIGPTAEGLFPDTSVVRLKEIGDWMGRNSEAIYGTSASPFRGLSWGRCTQKAINGGTRLYLHVFDWPMDGNLFVPGLLNRAQRAFPLAGASDQVLTLTQKEDGVLIGLGSLHPDKPVTVVVLDIDGAPRVAHPPDILAEHPIFVNDLDITFQSAVSDVEVRYTVDGTDPSKVSLLAKGPLRITKSTIVSARLFREGSAISPATRMEFTKVGPRNIENPGKLMPGISYSYFEGEWTTLPDFSILTPSKKGVARNIDLTPRQVDDYFALEFSGYLKIPSTGVYAFFVDSDDGSRLFIGDSLIVDNDGRHSMRERSGIIALAAGLHPLRVTFFEITGGDGLRVSFSGPGLPKQQLPDSILFHKEQ